MELAIKCPSHVIDAAFEVARNTPTANNMRQAYADELYSAGRLAGLSISPSLEEYIQILQRLENQIRAEVQALKALKVSP